MRCMGSDATTTTAIAGVALYDIQYRLLVLQCLDHILDHLPGITEYHHGLVHIEQVITQTPHSIAIKRLTTSVQANSLLITSISIMSAIPKKGSRNAIALLVPSAGNTMCSHSVSTKIPAPQNKTEAKLLWLPFKQLKSHQCGSPRYDPSQLCFQRNENFFPHFFRIAE
jgi:hypothetical protein